MNKRWFNETEKDNVRNAIWSTYQNVKQDNAVIDQLHERHLDLFCNVSIAGNPYFNTDVFNALYRNITFNVAPTIVDTLVSKIGTIKPGLQFLPEGSSYSRREKSQKLSDFIYGLFTVLDVYNVGVEVFRDACVFGTGFIKPYRCGNQIKCERVLPFQVHIDNIDGMYGKPKQFFQSKMVPKESLANTFPEHKDEILNIGKSVVDEHNAAESNVVDMVEVVEAWYIAPNPDDSRHVISTHNVLLQDVPYSLDCPPLIELRFKKRPVGFWGVGVIEEITSIQIEINKIIKMIARAIHVASNVWGFVPSNSGITPEHFSNEREELGIISYIGNIPPSIQTFNAVSPELFRYLNMLVEKAYEISGLSQANATSRKEKGITSGIAIQTMLDIQSERFLELETGYHDFFKRVAECCLQIADEIATDEDLSMPNVGKEFYEQVNWSDLEWAKDKYMIIPHPVSMVPKTPSGKLDFVEKLAQSQLLSGEEIRELLDLPDIERRNKLKLASRRLVEKTVELILSGKDYDALTQYDNLEYAIEYGYQAYQLAKLEESAEEEELDNLLAYIGDAETLIEEMQMAQQAAQAPPPEQGPPQGGQPPPEGMPPPQ